MPFCLPCSSKGKPRETRPASEADIGAGTSRPWRSQLSPHGRCPYSRPGRPLCSNTKHKATAKAVYNPFRSAARPTGGTCQEHPSGRTACLAARETGGALALRCWEHRGPSRGAEEKQPDQPSRTNTQTTPKQALSPRRMADVRG